MAAPIFVSNLVEMTMENKVADFDDLDFLARVRDLETDAGTIRGIPLGSEWIVNGQVREDSRAPLEWLERKAALAGWVTRCYEVVGGRSFYAAVEPLIEIHATHLGEGDDHLLGTCSVRDARAIVRALNGKGELPPGSEGIALAVIRLGETWTDEGRPYYTARPAAVDGERWGEAITGLYAGETWG